MCRSNDEASELTETRQELFRVQTTLKATEQSLTDQIKLLKEQLTSSNSRNDGISSNHADESRELRVQLKESADTTLSLNSQLVAAKTEASSLNARFSELENAHSKLIAALQTQESDKLQMVQKELGVAQTQLSNAQVENSKLSSQIQEFTVQNKFSTSVQAQESDKLQMTQKDLEMVRLQLTTSQSENSRLVAQNADFKSQLDTTSHVIQQKEELAKNQTRELDILKNQVEQSAAQNKILHDSLLKQNQNDGSDALESKLFHQNHVISSLANEEKRIFMEQNDKLVRAVESGQAMLLQVQDQLASCRNENSNLQTQIYELQSAKSQLMNSSQLQEADKLAMAAAKRDLEGVMIENSRLKLQKEELEHSQDKLIVALQAGESDKAAKQVLAGQQELHMMREKLTASQSESSRLNGRIAELESSLALTTTSLASKSEDYTKKLATAQKENRQMFTKQEQYRLAMKQQKLSSSQLKEVRSICAAACCVILNLRCAAGK